MSAPGDSHNPFAGPDPAPGPGGWGAAVAPPRHGGSWHGSSPDLMELASIVRASFAVVAGRTAELTKLFYGLLFTAAPETRDLFSVTMGSQRDRFLHALIQIVGMVDRPEDLNAFLRGLGRDHRKFGIADEHYDAVGVALLEAMALVSGPAWTPRAAGAWRRAYDLVATVMREAAGAERGPAVWVARVLEHRRLGHALAVIRVQTGAPVPYLAGQYLSVEIPNRPRMWRPLSPANPPGAGGVIDFHVRAVTGGWVSPAMVAHTRVGDLWRLGPPRGELTLQPGSTRDLLMVAGGTGLSPARAILEQLAVERSDRKVGLFYGGREWADLYAIERLRAMAHEHPWLTVIPAVESGGAEHGADRGTLAEVVARYGDWADRETMISGSPDMVRATVTAMLDAGTPLHRIHHDPFTSG